MIKILNNQTIVIPEKKRGQTGNNRDRNGGSEKRDSITHQSHNGKLAIQSPYSQAMEKTEQVYYAQQHSKYTSIQT